MTSTMLPETDSLLQVMMRPHFAMAFCANALLMLGLSYYMEKNQVEGSSAPAMFVYPQLYFNILSYVGLLSITTFLNSYQITRVIATGQSPPIKLEGLRRLWWPMNLICGSEGERSIVTFSIQMLCFPGMVIVVCLYCLSYVVNGPRDAMHWAMPLRLHLACSMAWKLFATGIVFTSNYLAAHNPTQPILIAPEDQ